MFLKIKKLFFNPGPTIGPQGWAATILFRGAATAARLDILPVNPKIYPLKLMVSRLSPGIQRWRLISSTIFSVFTLHTSARLLIPQISSQALIVRFGSEAFAEHLLDQIPILRPKNSKTQFRANADLYRNQIRHLGRHFWTRFRFLFVGWGTAVTVSL